MFEAGFQTDGTFSPDALIIGGQVHARKVTISAGADLARGAVLGRITASGEYTLSIAAATDGSQVPVAILATAAAAASADAEALIYESGDFNAAALIFGAGHTAASTRATLRDGGIFLVDVMA